MQVYGDGAALAVGRCVAGCVRREARLVEGAGAQAVVEADERLAALEHAEGGTWRGMGTASMGLGKPQLGRLAAHAVPVWFRARQSYMQTTAGKDGVRACDMPVRRWLAHAANGVTCGCRTWYGAVVRQDACTAGGAAHVDG